MDKIKILIIIISVFLLLGASCQDTLTRGRGKDGGGMEVSYSGTQGLIINFIEDMPPFNVWKDMDFSVGVDVHNMGIVDIERGKVCFSSMPSTIFNKPDGCKSLEEEGSIMGREYFSGGEIRDYIWEGYILEESYREDSPYPLIAKVCYEAETRASFSACIKSFTRGTESVCDAGEIALEGGKGQGAPIAVTSVYEDIVPKRGGNVDVRFTITVTNLGDGEVINLDDLNKENCNFERKEKNKVEIRATLVGYPELDCGDNEINLGSAGEGTILCKGNIPVEEGESFPLALNIKLDYGYLSTTSGGFTIKKDITEED